MNIYTQALYIDIITQSGMLKTCCPVSAGFHLVNLATCVHYPVDCEVILQQYYFISQKIFLTDTFITAIILLMSMARKTYKCSAFFLKMAYFHKFFTVRYWWLILKTSLLLILLIFKILGYTDHLHVSSFET